MGEETKIKTRVYLQCVGFNIRKYAMKKLVWKNNDT